MRGVTSNGIYLGFVVKVSKLCNLRCTYCYETPELANRARMSVEDITTMFAHVRDYLKDSDYAYGDCEIDFIWHGGEPFAQPLAYWEEIFAAQKKVFGARFQKRNIKNNVQTNLTLITKKHLPLIREYLHIGFSYDVINDLRVNIANNQTGDTVREKVEWLMSEGISLGGISVISKANIEHGEEIASYFLSRGLPFIALNLYEHLDDLPQAMDASVPFEQYLDFLKKLYDMPEVKTALAEGIAVNPLAEAHFRGEILKRDISGFDMTSEQCAGREWVLGVNTNGDLYGIGDMYNPEYRYGNIFKQNLEELLASPGRERRIKRSMERNRKVCSHCPMFKKSCIGIYVSQTSPENYRAYERTGGCEFSHMARYIAQRSSDENAAQRPAVPVEAVEETVTAAP